MGIGTRTLYEWKEKHPEISESLKRGKAYALPSLIRLASSSTSACSCSVSWIHIA